MKKINRRNDMASKLARVKETILELLSDEKEYTTDDIRKYIINKGIDLDSKSSVIRTAIYQLRSNGVAIFSRDRGIYQLRKREIRESNPLLKDLVTILPNEKTSPRYVYVHSNGKITISGKLNADIKTRQIEIRISSDAKRMALIPDGEYAHKFTKAGGTRNDELLKKLKSKHLSMPVTYMMEQDEKTGIWIGKMIKTPRNSKEK